MNNELILYPVLVLVMLTIFVWCRMYYTRLTEIFSKKINPQDLADDEQAKMLLKNVSGPSENLINLFEVPLLFYVAMFWVYIRDENSLLILILSWIFVCLRIIHSFIHITYNNVVQRFSVYFASCVTLWILWLKLLLNLVFNSGG